MGRQTSEIFLHLNKWACWSHFSVCYCIISLVPLTSSACLTTPAVVQSNSYLNKEPVDQPLPEAFHFTCTYAHTNNARK